MNSKSCLSLLLSLFWQNLGNHLVAYGSGITFLSTYIFATALRFPTPCFPLLCGISEKSLNNLLPLFQKG